ncbi:MAG TPA: peptidyl-prolyl cis-trans isomerase [Candidatus Sulfotelmatobacter sp.]|nr:peptidyl-prolyl cis-trans isomerase [Candidatus Sulfotelmatobacter sp.]
MRKSWLLCVLLGTLAWGQTAPSSPLPAHPAPAGNQAVPHTPAAPVDASASVPADAAVITVNGVCPPQPKPATAAAATKTAAKAAPSKGTPANCKTVITKAEFEKLTAAIAPTVTPQLKRQLSAALPRFVALSAEARKEGLDKKDDYKEMLKFVQMQILTNQLQRELQKEAADVPPAEIEKYYKDNPEAYTQYNFDRLFVPRVKQGENEAKDDDEKLTEEQQKAKEAAEKTKAEENEKTMAKVAADLRERAAKGEDFMKLQKEAFEAAGLKVDTPNVVLSNVRRTGLQGAHTAAFDLKPGEVSQVISDAGGHYIYKLNSTSQVPFEQAKNEIHSKLQNDRVRDKMEKLNSSFTSELNQAYFGAAGTGSLPPHPGRPGGMPPMPSPAQQQTPPPAQPPAAEPN